MIVLLCFWPCFCYCCCCSFSWSCLGTVSLVPLFVHMLIGVVVSPFVFHLRSLFLLKGWCGPKAFGLALVV